MDWRTPGPRRDHTRSAGSEPGNSEVRKNRFLKLDVSGTDNVDVTVFAAKHQGAVSLDSVEATSRLLARRAMDRQTSPDRVSSSEPSLRKRLRFTATPQAEKSGEAARQ